MQIPKPLEKSLLLLRLQNPLMWWTLPASEMLQTWEQKVYDRAIWKNDPASQGIIGSLNPWANTTMRENFILNATRNGKVSHRQILAIIGAYREVAKATGKKSIDPDFTTRMIAVFPEAFGTLDRLDVASVGAIVPGWLDPTDGILYEWLHGKSFSTDDKVKDAVDRLQMNAKVTAKELDTRVQDTLNALSKPTKTLITIAVVGGLLWIMANLKTIAK